MSVKVVVDARFDDLAAPRLDITDRGRCAAWVAEALADGVHAVVVVGDDATLAALATAFTYDVHGRSEPLTFYPLAAGALHTVADSLNAAAASKRNLSRAVGDIETGRLKPRLISTLRVVDSMQTGCELAFGLGLGGIVDLVGADRGMRRRDALKQAMRGVDMVDADVFVDWQPVASRFGYLLASSVERSWSGVQMGAGATLRFGDSPLDLVRGATRVGRVVERVSGGRALAFRRVHIDTNNDYVVDGLVRRSTKPRVVALTPGPQVRVFAKP